ncbi:MAG TPA: hypothetical protein PLC59_09160 [Bacteroidales bacterium]|nr:hypothetical protein [Bacteroidales bacterium]
MDFYRVKKLLLQPNTIKKVIAPILQNELGLICVVPEYSDTDKPGIFSGEVENH